VKKASPAKKTKTGARKKQSASAKKSPKAPMAEERTTKEASTKPAKGDLEPKQMELDDDEAAEELDEDMSDEIEDDMDEELALEDEEDDVDYLEKSEELLDEGDDYRTH
jgi:hypothetical protein